MAWLRVALILNLGGSVVAGMLSWWYFQVPWVADILMGWVESCVPVRSVRFRSNVAGSAAFAQKERVKWVAWLFLIACRKAVVAEPWSVPWRPGFWFVEWVVTKDLLLGSSKLL